MLGYKNNIMLKKKQKKRPAKKIPLKKEFIKKSKQVDRFWGLAKRLEHTRVGNKRKKSIK